MYLTATFVVDSTFTTVTIDLIYGAVITVDWNVYVALLLIPDSDFDYRLATDVGYICYGSGNLYG